MLYREGTANDFGDLMLQYIEFLQCYNDDTIAWNLIDPRLNTYYGATMSIPMSDYKVEESSYIKPFDADKLPYKRGTIVSYGGHNYRQLVDDCMDVPSDESNDWHKMHKTNVVVFYDNGVESRYIKDFNTNEIKQNKDYFEHTLIRTLPNSNVTAVNFDELITTVNPRGYIDYVANANHDIDKLIVFVNRLGFEFDGERKSAFIYAHKAPQFVHPICRYDEGIYHDGDVALGMDGIYYLNICNQATPSVSECHCMPHMGADHWKPIFRELIASDLYDSSYNAVSEAQHTDYQKILTDFYSGKITEFKTDADTPSSAGGKGFGDGDIAINSDGLYYLNISDLAQGGCGCPIGGAEEGVELGHWLPMGKFSDVDTRFATRSTDEFIRAMDDLDYECYQRGIDVEYVYAPSILYIRSKSYVESISFINFLNNYITKYTKSKVHNFFTDILNKFDSSFLSKIYSTYALKDNTANYIAYNKSISSLLTRYLMNKLFHTSVGEIFVSFHYNEITSSTYYNFIYNNDEYMSEELDKLQASYRSIRSKYSPLNPFRNSGSLVSVGVHTSFDYDVWMCEQGGINCKKEEDEQINDINLLPFWIFTYGTPSKRLDPAVYPTTGCPWFTMSTGNRSKYLISSDNPIHYYFVKDNSNSTITIRFCDGHGQLADVWQTISFGKLEQSFDGFNINPLYCVGGNSALSPDTWTYYVHSHVEGLSYDLDFKNPSLVNSNFLHPTKFGSANLSNFRVMVNSGEWRDMYAHYQTFSTYQYYSLSSVIYQWGVPLNAPTDTIGNSTHTAYPFGSPIRDRIDTYSVKKREYMDDYMYKFTSGGQLDRLTIYLYDNDTRNGV